MKIKSEKAGLHENWWKSLLFCLKQTGHNLCLNLWFDQSLAFAIWGTKEESPPEWYERLKFLNSDSDKKALWSSFAISFVLMWMRKKIFVTYWHYDHLCDLVHTYVDELKFMFQIGTVIFPMLLTNAFHFTNLFLVFVITLFPSVT